MIARGPFFFKKKGPLLHSPKLSGTHKHLEQSRYLSQRLSWKGPGETVLWLQRMVFPETPPPPHVPRETSAVEAADGEYEEDKFVAFHGLDHAGGDAAVKAHAEALALHVMNHIGKIPGIEGDIQLIALKADFQFFVNIAALGIGGHFHAPILLQPQIDQVILALPGHQAAAVNGVGKRRAHHHHFGGPAGGQNLLIINEFTGQQSAVHLHGAEGEHDMGIIDENIYREAIKNPSSAIEQINQRIPLKEEQQIEFENRVSDYMLENEETFKLLPPMLLAKQYQKALEEKKKEQKQDENGKSDGKLDTKISKLENRMDELSSNLYHKQDLFFADITNISDTYDGYMQMFKVREETLGQDGDDKSKRDIISANRDSLGKLIDDYDNRWNLQDVQSADADKLNERFDELNEELEKLDVNDETLELVSNFHFINENNEPEPQFIDKDGKPTLKYSKGCQVAQNSKLANIIRVAKQNVLMEMLGSKDDLDNEKLQAALNEKVPEVLYAAHVANQVEQGIKENPNQFTDKKYLNQFITNLGNTEKPMSVSPTAYEATIDGCINAVGGFAHRLGSKIGKDKAVVTKLFNPLKDLDKRADDRTTKRGDKRAYRIEMLKRTIKGGVSAFLVSGAITVVGTMAATDAFLTAATGGLNKFTGMALGSAFAIGMTAYQIHNWNKDRKARGGKTGPKAFFKDMIKDRRLAMTIGTTALGAAALGFAVTNNPGVAQALGIGALALGTSNMAINTVQDAKEQGVSTLEGIGWAALQSVVNVGAAFGGRLAANEGIDAFNNRHKDNNIFQHGEKIGTREIEVTTTEIEIGYRDGVVENAQKILDYWYNDNPELLQQRIEAIESYNAEHGTNINPQRYLLAAHDAGALSADNNLLHNQGGEDFHTHSNHKVLGQGWSNTTGVAQSTVDTLAGSINGGDVNITPESINAFNQIDRFISANNQVGYAEGAPYQNDGVLGYNAEADASGRMVASENGDRWTTYADGDSAFEQKIVEKTTQEEVNVYGMVRNETDLGLGMFGVLGRKLQNLQLKERIGSLKDRIIKKDKTPNKGETGNKVAATDKGEKGKTQNNEIHPSVRKTQHSK